MPEHIRALLVVLLIAIVSTAIVRTPATALAINPADYIRRRNAWFGITLVAFLAHNFWIFIAVAGIVVFAAATRERNPLALFFSLMFAVPLFSSQIGGLGFVEQIFTMHYLRLLELVVLLPIAFRFRSTPGTPPFGRTLPDKLLLVYLALQFFLMLRGTTFTNAMRLGIFYGFLDVLLPYYVASRGLRDLPGFRDALMAFVVATILLSVIAVFETAKGWLLYASLQEALGADGRLAGYAFRPGGMLRADASIGQPIPLGFVIAVGIGFLLYLRRAASPRHRAIAFATLSAGLVATLSRGPGVGAAAMVLTYIATGANGARRVLGMGVAGLLALPLVLMTPLGDTLLRNVPFFGSGQDATITYRERLLEIAADQIMVRPFFGGFSYDDPALQELVQGEGIIDIVNTYVGVGLGSGLVGLSLFCAFFAVVAFGVRRGMRAIGDPDDERHALGRALLATLVGILIIIFTVSSITVIPYVYWTVAGVSVAYARFAARADASEAAPGAVAGGIRGSAAAAAR